MSEQLFRGYEPEIQQIVSRYPKPSTITFTGASPSTVRQHLKAALWTFVNNPTIISVIPRDQAALVLREFSFSQNLDGSVYIGPRRSTRKQHVVQLATDSSSASIPPIDGTNPTTLNAILHLKNFDLLPFSVQILNLLEIKIAELQDQYPNVEFVPLTEPGSYTVL